VHILQLVSAWLNTCRVTIYWKTWKWCWNKQPSRKLSESQGCVQVWEELFIANDLGLHQCLLFVIQLNVYWIGGLSAAWVEMLQFVGQMLEKFTIRGDQWSFVTLHLLLYYSLMLCVVIVHALHSYLINCHRKLKHLHLEFSMLHQVFSKCASMFNISKFLQYSVLVAFFSF